MSKEINLNDALKRSLVVERHPPNEMPNMPLSAGKKKLKRIEVYTDIELDNAVNSAIEHCGLHGIDFWKIMCGIDAYMQRRKRRDDRRAEANYVEEECDPWGNS